MADQSPKAGKTRKILLIAVLVLTGILLAAVLGFLAWAGSPRGPDPAAMQAMQSDSQVQVSTQPWLVFQPAGKEPVSGVIIYPGGRVDYRSYAPYARAFAEAGILTVIPRMPLNLAVLSPEIAGEVMAAYPQVENWVLAGHSLGGAMAARYAFLHPDQVGGLSLWAAYPAGDNDLSAYDIPIQSVYGTLDGVAPPETIRASARLLPAEADFISIEGGNHAQFGWYGPQPGDNPPEITHEQQQAQTVAAVNRLLEQLQSVQP